MLSRKPKSPKRGVLVAICAGLLLIGTALGVTLGRSPPIVVGTNSVIVHGNIGLAKEGLITCQPTGLLPQGTSAIRISAGANVGPMVSVSILAPPQIIQGERGAGWGVQESVTVPIKPLSSSIRNARVCTTFGPTAFGAVELNESVTPTTTGGRFTPIGSLRLEYLRPSPRTWWSLAPSVIDRMGLGHAPGGTWVVYAVIALMIAVAALAAGVTLSETR